MSGLGDRGQQIRDGIVSRLSRDLASIAYRCVADSPLADIEYRRGGRFDDVDSDDSDDDDDGEFNHGAAAIAAAALEEPSFKPDTNTISSMINVLESKASDKSCFAVEFKRAGQTREKSLLENLADMTAKGR